MPTTTLAIIGYQNKPVPHAFIRQDNEANHLAIFLPGFAYSCDMPIFYYAETLALSAGADLLRLEYAYNREPNFLNVAPDEMVARLLADASPGISVALDQRDYVAVSVVAKSLGTITLAHLLASGALPKHTKAIWTTPILDNETVVATIRSHVGPQLIVIGESDPAYDAGLVEALAQVPGLHTLTIADADHSLDIPGDTITSIAAMSATIEAIASYWSTN